MLNKIFLFQHENSSLNSFILYMCCMTKVKISSVNRKKIVLSVFEWLREYWLSIFYICSLLKIERKNYYRWKRGDVPIYFYTLLFAKIDELVEKNDTKKQVIDKLKTLTITPRYHELKYFRSELWKSKNIEDFF